MGEQMKNCLRCGLPESDPKHDRTNPPAGGWHPFRGQDYLDGLEDALLFVREKKQLHQWEETGMVIPVGEPFLEKHCKVCGAINWGGNEDGICFGNNQAEAGVIAAHNRRAVSLWNREDRNGWILISVPDTTDHTSPTA